MTEREMFYGRRKGHKLSPRKLRLLETVLPKLAIRPYECSPGALDPLSLFPFAAADCWLEIGFGKGEHLAWQAKHHPDTAFIGCEPFVNGVAALLGRITEEKLANIHIYPEIAAPLMRSLAPSSIGRVFLLHPDPWPKKRHAKRRFVSPANLDQLARIMKQGADLRLGSDHPAFIAWTMRQMQNRRDFEWAAERAADWRNPPADWPETRYQAKAKEARRPCAYLTFVRI